jgi:phosphate-selective porin OprO/OprP
MNWYLNNFVRLQLNAIDWTIVSPDAKGVVVNDHGQSVVGRAQIAF